jgi:hypothetical protein
MAFSGNARRSSNLHDLCSERGRSSAQETGSKTVIGAGSVVTSGIPDVVFAAGNPLR